jgi:hypothetical protein
MRDPSITDEQIDRWLHNCVLTITANALAAQGMIGVVEINERTIHGHIWSKFKVAHDSKKSTIPFQFFFRTEELDRCNWAERVIKHLIDSAQLKREIINGIERLIPTTPLDELAKILNG